MPEPIRTRETTTRTEPAPDREWTYDEILKLFPDDDGSLVNPLVRRCQQYEAEIEQLRRERKPGTWPQVCLQRAFVEGAKWWQFHYNGSTEFSSERHEMETEALRRYGEPKTENEP